MRFDIEERDSIYSYFEKDDHLMLGEMGETHISLLYRNGYLEANVLEIEGKTLYDVTKFLYDSAKEPHSFGYVIGSVAYIDTNRTNCNIDNLTKRLMACGKFTAVEVV